MPYTLKINNWTSEPAVQIAQDSHAIGTEDQQLPCWTNMSGWRSNQLFPAKIKSQPLNPALRRQDEKDGRTKAKFSAETWYIQFHFQRPLSLALLSSQNTSAEYLVCSEFCVRNTVSYSNLHDRTNSYPQRWSAAAEVADITTLVWHYVQVCREMAAHTTFSPNTGPTLGF